MDPESKLIQVLILSIYYTSLIIFLSNNNLNLIRTKNNKNTNWNWYIITIFVLRQIFTFLIFKLNIEKNIDLLIEFSIYVGGILDSRYSYYTLLSSDLFFCQVAFFTGKNLPLESLSNLLSTKNIEKIKTLDLEDNFFKMLEILITKNIHILSYTAGFKRIPWKIFTPALIISICIKSYFWSIFGDLVTYEPQSLFIWSIYKIASTAFAKSNVINLNNK